MKLLLYILTLVLLGAISLPAQSNKAIFYQSLAWSPDGQDLTFTAMSDYDEKTDHYRTEVFISKADGTQLQKVSGEVSHAFSSVWSKDGKRILFSADTPDEKETDIFSVNKDGSDLIQLTRNTGRNTAPSISPDGGEIAFMSARNGEKYQIYVMDAEGAKAQKLTTDPANSFCNPVWSGDGQKIVYYSDKSDRKDQIWIMNADGSNQTLLTNGTGHNIFPSFSPDSKQIILSRRDDRDAEKSYTDASYLFVMNADGTNLKALAQINSFNARFSPDGKRIAFITGKFPNNNIFIVNPDGSNIKKIL
jgi:Tol biopolymer transport system component